MAAKLRNLFSLLGRSALGSAILMTLAAVFIAGLLPLEVQARQSHDALIASANIAIRSPDVTASAPP